MKSIKNGLAAVTFLVTVTGAIENTRTEGGGDMPFYARIKESEIIYDGKWAAIIFYRPMIVSTRISICSTSFRLMPLRVSR